MTDAQLTALATVLLVIVGTVQVMLLKGQSQQQRLSWAESYRRRWVELINDWGTVVFIGRRHNDYYQIAHLSAIEALRTATKEASADFAVSWAQASVRNVCGTLSDICMRVLQGQISIRDVYPIFGSELLRQGVPLRNLLDGNGYDVTWYGAAGPTEEERRHDSLRYHVQFWLQCHDGTRRRTLILIDLLWAEAARLEDLQAYEVINAANRKASTGYMNKDRIFSEVLRIGGWRAIYKAWRLRGFLGHAEWQRFPGGRGLSRKRMAKLSGEVDCP
jgi:hypothetical protein